MLYISAGILKNLIFFKKIILKYYKNQTLIYKLIYKNTLNSLPILQRQILKVKILISIFVYNLTHFLNVNKDIQMSVCVNDEFLHDVKIFKINNGELINKK